MRDIDYLAIVDYFPVYEEYFDSQALLQGN